MSRRLLIAAAAIAAAGFVTASARASARYVVSGKTEFGNVRMVHLTVHDGAVYRMYLRSVSSGKRRDSGGRTAAAVAWGAPTRADLANVMTGRNGRAARPLAARFLPFTSRQPGIIRFLRMLTDKKTA